MKKSILFFALLCSGCQNLYKDYYRESLSHNSDNTVFYIGEPKIYSSGDIMEDSESCRKKGYTVIGTSKFNSATIGNSESKISKVAKTIGAEIVLWNEVYTNTVSGAVPYTYYTPQTQTSYYSGSVSNAYRTSPAYNYSGSMTTYSQQQNTTYIPYSINRYDYLAVFFGKTKNIPEPIEESESTDSEKQVKNDATHPKKLGQFGFFARNLSRQEMAQSNSKSGVYILLNVPNSDDTVSASELTDGDIITKIDAKQISDISDLSSFNFSNFRKVKVEFLRSGRKKSIMINLMISAAKDPKSSGFIDYKQFFAKY